MSAINAKTFFSGLFASIMSLFLQAPLSLRTLVAVAFILTLVESITSMVVAGMCGRLSPAQERREFVAKLTQYFILGIVCAASSIVFHLWLFIYAGVWFALSYEVSSLLQQMVCLSKCGGVDMKAAQPLIDIISRSFEPGQDKSLQEIKSTSDG